MNKKLIVLGVLILAICVIGRLLWVGFNNLKAMNGDFKPASVIFVIDSSASNQPDLPSQIKYLKSLCAMLDPEDHIKILKASQDAYLIYEGSPDTATVSKSLEAFTKLDEKDYGTAYGEAMKKAVSHSLNMYKEGYTPAIVIIGDLENEGNNIEKQLNWDTLPANISKAKESMPELTMMFLYADPKKLDMVKEKLSPVLGEKHLIVASEQMANKVTTKFLEVIGR